LVEGAVGAAKGADVAVIFAGLPDAYESEGYDRGDMRMPDCHNQLIESVCAAQGNTVVVLHNGAPVEMPWADRVKGTVEAYLGGQAVGAAVVDVLFGDVNPSGRLAETVPYKLEDNPSFLFYKGEDGVTYYNEGVFVGYRYYMAKKMSVRYPFGFGLSYTEFDYSDLRLDKSEIAEGDVLTVTVDVTNTGKVAGKEVVQLYVAAEKGEIIRPVRELRGFEKVWLSPGESKSVTFSLDLRAFSYWDEAARRWAVENGDCFIQICKDADTVILQVKVRVSDRG
jgi:beta-glucosidase